MPITINGSEGITNASWTTATRPSNPVAGQQGFNTDLGFTEVYDGTEWIADVTGFVAEGGTVATITDGGVTYKVHTFTSSGTFNVIADSVQVEYLVVAGGGSGGSRWHGAGGGAGGYRSSVTGESSGGGASAESKLTLTANTYTVTIGAGGAAVNGDNVNGNQGSPSVFGAITSTGGGYGASYPSPGGSGGSGGGGAGSPSTPQAGGSGTFGQGFAGGAGDNEDGNGNGGGGGGAGAVGQAADGVNGGNGGDGVASEITGFSVIRAGGGGGAGTYNGGSSGLGGAGGGGSAATPGVAGAVNTGGGGGGADSSSTSVFSGAGGSGIVIIRYPI